MRPTFKNVSEYIHSAPAPTHGPLKRLRALVRKVAPTATETISYGIPAFKLNGAPLVYFGGFAKHVGVFGVYKQARALGVSDKYFVSKGTLRFSLDEPLPVSMLTKLVRLRAKQISLDAKGTQKSKPKA